MFVYRVYSTASKGQERGHALHERYGERKIFFILQYTQLRTGRLIADIKIRRNLRRYIIGKYFCVSENLKSNK